ncbi:MAG: glutamate--tRNA ligase, partial [Verrucomicrobia bacterium]|nr:glutamate--tRNA ligase [Verrucomicrobiota bacterium]
AGSSIASYIEGGYAPEAVANYLCLLGWSPKDNREKIDLAEVVQIFELEKINRRNAAFDLDKCFWLNGQYIATVTPGRFRTLCLPWMDRAGLDYSGRGEAYLDAVLGSIKEKIKTLRDVPAWTAFFFTDDFPFDAEAVQKTLRAPGANERLGELRARLAELPEAEFTHDGLEPVFKALAAAHGVKTAAYIHPARVAVSGRSVGPSLYHMLAILGKERVLARLAAAPEKAAAATVV